MPIMTVDRVAYGAGQHDLREQPNLLRLIIGEQASDLDRDQITMLEATIDDMNPQFFEPLLDRLFEAGALDVFLIPVTMKKSRPGTVLTVLADHAVADRCASVILTHSTTFGVRAHTATRWKLPRDLITVTTRYGQVRVKRGFTGDRVTILTPEYEDCRRLAQTAGIPIHVVYDEARRAAGQPEASPSGESPPHPGA
jgi:hypothetical protein